MILYVDDMLVACKDLFEVENLKALLSSEFDMKDLGEAKKILGMELLRVGQRASCTLVKGGTL